MGCVGGGPSVLRVVPGRLVSELVDYRPFDDALLPGAAERVAVGQEHRARAVLQWGGSGQVSTAEVGRRTHLHSVLPESFVDAASLAAGELAPACAIR